MKNDNPKYLVVGPPRGGFTLLISVINELYRLKNIQKDEIQNTVNHFVPLAGEFVSTSMDNFFKKYISLEDLFYSGEFRKVLVGGPKWLDNNDTNTMCVRKYLGVKGLGDFTFIQYHPRFLLDYDEVVHSHNHPSLWQEHPDFADYMKFASIRNPMDIIHSSVYSINALASEYIQRCVSEDETTIRHKLALNKFTNPDFMEGLVIYLVNYLKDFLPVKNKFLYVMKWEDLIFMPVDTILKIAYAGGFNITGSTAEDIWEKIQYRNLTRWHRHSFRKGAIGDWKLSITNTHLELFKTYGFDEFLEELGYEKINYFKETDYTPIQKTIEEYLKKGKIYKPHEDDDLYTFAFNKTNLTSSKFPFKSYTRIGDVFIERSTFKDESIIRGIVEVIGNAVGIANRFLTEIRKVHTIL
ncbi:MAG: sulfotransferase domain-containing protein [Candidatus Omnitrophica bacterium]|nr:sulfotransferase domain-containing protein [Candidatus Omnitrophota bacterium]